MNVKTYLYEEPNIDKIDMISTIISLQLTNLTFDKIISGYVGSLSKNFMNFIPISQYLNSVDRYKGSARLEYLLITFPDFDLDPDLQSFSLHLQTL